MCGSSSYDAAFMGCPQPDTGELASGSALIAVSP